MLVHPRPDLASGGGLPPGVQLPGFGGSARAMRGRGHRPPPPPKPPKVPWWRKLMPQNKVAPKEKEGNKENESGGAKERTMDATAKVLPLLHIGALGRQSIIVGLVKADVPASWYVTPVVRAIVSIQWASFAKVLMALHLLEHLLLMCMYGAFLLLIHRSFTQETAQSREDDMDDDEQLQLLLGRFPVNQHAVLNTIGGGVVMAGLALFTISMLVTRAKQLQVSGVRMWAGNLVNLVDLMSGILIIAIFVAFAVPASYTVVLSIGALEVLVLFMRLLFFSAIAERMGSLVRTVVETVKDVRFFFILLGILYGGFAIAFNMQLGGESDQSQPTAVYLFTTMVGDFSTSFVLSSVLQEEGQWLVPELAAFLWCVYGFFMSVVLLTLLVAIMNDTYNRIRDAEEAEVLRLKARIIADLQSLLSPEATQLIQDKTLGPFLHELTPVLGDHLGASKAQADQESQLWQMRMMVRSEVRNALLTLSKQGILSGPHTGMGTTTSFAPTSHAPTSHAPSTTGPTPSPSGRMGFADVTRDASMVAKQYNKGAANSMSHPPSEASQHAGAEAGISELREDLQELKEMVKGMQASMQRAPSPDVEASLHKQGGGAQDGWPRSWKREALTRLH
ncbi:hypothetical protein DUNSADRAFT_16913 [Dunaliella salina]|uniref:Ion transport domain-containing protein n=1 Tax=Dunaliella salina TaxID=3046 RepID=A0ABQ7H986_DUNSA|nr:hypothetical protein DUNSADRAFT_16913 [Dunaliella salina]|eukprot:KAF5843415.1 hypothetical protein DUNSADRAFT_16913 [Dunaliella salina]